MSDAIRSAPQPITMGHSQRTLKRGQLPRRRVHAEHLMGLLLAAEGDYLLGPDQIVLGGPVMWYLPAGEEEFLNIYGRNDGWWVGFEWPEVRTHPAEGRSLVVELGEQRTTTTRWKPIDAVAIARVAERFIALDAAMHTSGWAGALTASAIVQQIFGAYLQLPDGRDLVGGHRELERFHSLLVQHAFDDTSINQLAEQVEMSSDHLRVLFHKRWGLRPVEYRTELRLGKARELLLSSKMNVKQVARAVGYPDPVYFARLFHARYKMGPREMIRRYRLMLES